MNATVPSGETGDDLMIEAVSLSTILAGVKAVGTVTEKLGLLKTADDKVRAHIEHQKDVAALAVIPEILERVKRLEEKFAEDRNSYAADFAAIRAAWSKAWDRTDNPKKRRVIMAALVNAFDEATYDEALTTRLFSILEDLDYGEIYLLAKVCEPGFPSPKPKFENYDAGTLSRYFLERLIDAKLLRVKAGHGNMSATNLGESVLDHVARGRIEVTDLGKRMQLLVRDRPGHKTFVE